MLQGTLSKIWSPLWDYSLITWTTPAGRSRISTRSWHDAKINSQQSICFTKWSLICLKKRDEIPSESVEKLTSAEIYLEMAHAAMTHRQRFISAWFKSNKWKWWMEIKQRSFFCLKQCLEKLCNNKIGNCTSDCRSVPSIDQYVIRRRPFGVHISGRQPIHSTQGCLCPEKEINL